MFSSFQGTADVGWARGYDEIIHGNHPGNDPSRIRLQPKPSPDEGEAPPSPVILAYRGDRVHRGQGAWGIEDKGNAQGTWGTLYRVHRWTGCTGEQSAQGSRCMGTGRQGAHGIGYMGDSVHRE